MSEIKQTSTTAQSESEISRRLLSIVNLVRLLTAVTLLIIYQVAAESSPWGLAYPNVYQIAVVALLSLSVMMSLGILNKKTSLTKLAFIGSVLDSIIFAFLMYSSGGFDGGLSIMLILSLGAASLVLPRQIAIFCASIGVLAILVQLFISDISNATRLANYTSAGLFGVFLLLTSLGAQYFGERYRETEALAKSRAVDIANLSQLNDYVVQRMRESIVVLDENGYTRLMNQSAARLLGAHNPKSRYHLAELAPRLHKQWQEFIKSPFTRNEQSLTLDGYSNLIPNFITLGIDASHGTLLFLEDMSLIQEKVQQSKLAALGRLSAGIAHEIRNPLAAISHSNQLLSESENLDEDDKYFTNVTNKQVKRLNQIIENVLGLTRAPLDNKPDILDLHAWLTNYTAEFIETHQLKEEQIELNFPASSNIKIPFGESQFRQVLGNIFQNALNHAAKNSAQVKIQCIAGIHEASGRTKLEIIDNGDGLNEDELEQLFEPFYSGTANGSGLGLYISRELCTLNYSTLVAENSEDSGACFRVLFADTERWLTK